MKREIMTNRQFWQRVLAAAIAGSAFACAPPLSAKFTCATKADCVSGFACRDQVCVAIGELCQGVECGHGQCSVKDEAPVCTCEDAYSGAACGACAAGHQDRDTDGTCTADCATAALACGHGACADASGTAKCACEAGYQGDACGACAAGHQDKDTDGTCSPDCATAALACGHGACADASGAALCACEAHYEGATCSACTAGYQDRDGDKVCAPDCATAALSCGHGACADASGAAKCACDPGYTGAACAACAAGYQDKDNNGTCAPDCATAALSCGHGSCADAAGAANCACETGYTGAGCSVCADAYVMLGDACRPRTQLLGSAANENARTLLEDASGFYLGGTLSGASTTMFGGTTAIDANGAAFVAGFDASASATWQTFVTGGGRKDGLGLLAMDGAGHFHLSGWVTSQTLLFNGANPLVVGNDCPVISLTHAGEWRWAKSIAGECYAIATDPAGNVYAVGGAQSTDFGAGQINGAGGYDILMVSYGPDGAFRWGKLIGAPSGGHGTPGEILNDVTTDAAGNVYTVGHISGPTDFGGGALNPNTSLQAQAMVVASYSSTGAHRWSKMFPRSSGTGWSQGTKVAVSANGIVAVFGNFSGPFDFGDGLIQQDPAFASQAGSVLVTLDAATGRFRHQRGLLKGLPVNAGQLVFDAHEDLHVVGNINNGGGDFGGGTVTSGAFRAKYGSDLSYQSAKVAGGGAYPTVNGISLRPDGSQLLMGNLQTSIDWGYGSRSSSGATDIWLTWLP